MKRFLLTLTILTGLATIALAQNSNGEFQYILTQAGTSTTRVSLTSEDPTIFAYLVEITVSVPMGTGKITKRLKGAAGTTPQGTAVVTFNVDMDDIVSLEVLCYRTGQQ